MAENRVADLYSAAGTRKGVVDLAPEFFGIEPNVPVMHQVVTAQLAAARAGTHSTKTRAEVRGGGRKPWRQKGLGRARHGSIRSPQWAGGGVAHGPRPRSYAQRTPRRMRQLALRGALSDRAAENAVKVVEEFDWAAPKTRSARELLAAIGVEGNVLVVVTPEDGVAERSFRNLASVLVTRVDQLNTYDVMWSATVLFTSASLEALSQGGVYDVSESDFVREDAGGESAGDEGGEAE